MLETMSALCTGCELGDIKLCNKDGEIKDYEHVSIMMFTYS
jgi:hypothetical protein